MVLSYYGVWLRSGVSKKNPKRVMNYACRGTFMLKMGLLGLMDTVRGPISPYWYLIYRVMIFSYYGVWLRSVVSKKNPKRVMNYARRATFMLQRSVFGLMDTVRGPISP